MLGLAHVNYDIPFRKMNNVFLIYIYIYKETLRYRNNF